MSTRDFLEVIRERGCLHQCSDEAGFRKLTAERIVTGYIGFDMTADSLHIGNLVQIMMLRRLQQTGHRPIVLIGGGTTKVGDPSGRDEVRKLLTDADIARNMASIKATFGKFIRFGDGPSDGLMANNDDWLSKLNYIEFLRDYGRHFSVNRMLSMDSVKLRLERDQPLSFLEFNYMVLQSYDFAELARRYDCRLQMGGSDQWGNIVQGVDLGRRVGTPELFAVTTPLVTTSSGAKMGKTAAGAVWLNEDRLSHYDYYQYWRNTEDADVGRFLKIFTDLPIGEIRRLEALKGSEINEAKKVLAFEATKMCRGEKAAAEAAETARKAFEEGEAGGVLPTVSVARAQLDAGMPVWEALKLAGFASSNGEARRLVRGGGVRINDDACDDENRKISASDLTAEGIVKLSAGKKRHAVVKVA
ncbi:MAG: tyrosine--tRNA ligase [Alphaproteobacteria bacterium]|nr:tyrosine--tRNA ligase [Alphaproteobacteria bacterium]